MVLSNVGDQVPLIPFDDVDGNGLNVVPTQIEAIGLKVGNVAGVIVMVKLAFVAH